MPSPQPTMPRIKVLENTFRWGSHRPVLAALFEAFSPRTVLELGVGESSTPFLHTRAGLLVSVENNSGWLQRIVSRLPARSHFFPRHHPAYTDASRTTELHFASLERDVDPFVLESAREYYRRLVHEFGRFDLVLVDQASSTRRVALEVLAPHADLIAMHDTEECGLPPADPNYDKYEYGHFFSSPAAAPFRHFRFDAMTPWTDVLIRSSLPCDPPTVSRRYNTALAEYCAGFPGHAPLHTRDNYLLRAPAELGPTAAV